MAVLPSNISYSRVVGRYWQTQGDGIDPDEYPDGIPWVGLTGTITPGARAVRDVLASPKPIWLSLNPVSFTTDINGDVITLDGKPLWIVSSDDPDLSPNDWTYTVQITGPSNSGFNPVKFAFIARSGVEVDLVKEPEVPASQGTVIPGYSSILAQVLAARDLAIAAAVGSVKSVNGISPDGDGNVVVSGGGGGGPSDMDDITDATVLGKGLVRATTATIARGLIGAIDNTPGTSAAAGVLELATPAEALAGVDTARAVTAEGLKAVADTKIPKLTDPNVDALLFWDDSAGAYANLLLGTNLSITGTTLNATGGGGTVVDASETVKGIVELATAAEVAALTDNTRAVTPLGLASALSGRALDSGVVHLTGAETLAGVKTFSSAPVVPDGSFAQAKIVNLLSDLALLAPKASPALTGVPTAPTAAGGTNNTQVATTAFVQAAQAGAVQLTGAQSITGAKSFAAATLLAAVRGDVDLALQDTAIKCKWITGTGWRTLTGRAVPTGAALWRVYDSSNIDPAVDATVTAPPKHGALDDWYPWVEAE